MELAFAKDWGDEAVDASRLVSLIMPSYNHERFVGNAVQSALDQDYSPMEIIIVDDGSEDNTAEEVLSVVQAYAGDKRIRFFRQANQGLSRTLNSCLALTEGAFVQFLASDDAYLPHKTQACLRLFETSSRALGAVYCNGYLIDQHGHRLGRFTDKYMPPASNEVYENLLVGNWIPALGVLYRTAALRDIGGFDESLAVEDYDLLLRLSRQFTVLRSDEKCFEYRWHASNFSKDAARMQRQFALIAAKHPDLARYQAFRAAISHRSPRAVFQTLSVFNIRVALRSLLRSVQNRFFVHAASPWDLGCVVSRKAARLVRALIRARLRALTGVSLGPGTRLFGKVLLRGCPRNVTIGRNVQILGDLVIVTSAGHVPGQIVVGDNVVLEHNATLFSLGGTLIVEDGAFIGPGVVIQANGDVYIGKHSMLASNASVYANSHRTKRDGVPYSRQGNQFIGVRVGDNCWLGAGVTVLDGTTLGEGCVVGANSVVKGRHQAGSRLVARALIASDVGQQQ